MKKLIYKTCSHLNIAEILRLSTNHWNAVDLWARDSLSTRELLIELYNIKIQLSVLVNKHTIIVQSKCKLVSPRYNCGRSRFTNSYDRNVLHEKQHKIHSLVGMTPCSYGQNRKEQVVLIRCRIDHSRLTHSYLNGMYSMKFQLFTKTSVNKLRRCD